MLGAGWIFGIFVAFIAGALIWSRFVERLPFEDGQPEERDTPRRIFMRLRLSRMPGWYRGFFARVSSTEIVIGQHLLFSKRRVVMARIIGRGQPYQRTGVRRPEYSVYRIVSGAIQDVTSSGYPVVDLRVEEIDPNSARQLTIKLETTNPQLYRPLIE